MIDLGKSGRCIGATYTGYLTEADTHYSAYLAKWRKQLANDAPGARRRGPKAADPLIAENEKLRKRARKAEAELATARQVIEVQGKVSALLEQMLDQDAQTGKGER